MCRIEHLHGEIVQDKTNRHWQMLLNNRFKYIKVNQGELSKIKTPGESRPLTQL